MSQREPTPEEYRKRYMALKAKAEKVNAARPAANYTPNPEVLPADQIVLEDTIPAGWYWTGKIAKGRTLRIRNDHATNGVAALFWNANDLSERFNPGDTVKVQWTARITRGQVLLSDMGRAMVSITEDTCGYNDCIANGTTRKANDRKYGEDGYRRNTHDNFILAAGKHDMTVRDVGPCVSFFSPVVTDAEGRFSWKDDVVKAGAYVDLRAEMDLIVALSNCPHILCSDTEWHAEPVSFQIWKSPAAGAEDFCRTFSEEAERAFENTDTYLAQN